MTVVSISKFISENFNVEPLALEAKRHSPALDLRPQRPKSYVEPTVSVETKEAPIPAPILLVSAAGAMGKTVTSKAIAEQLGCPRLDLAHLTVGQDTHSGVLNRVLTGKSLGTFMDKLDRGVASLIIDALDEAPLRSGERAFFAFIESLAEDAAAFSTPNHQFIVLGRPQTVELLSDLCKDLDVATTEVTLDSLSLNSSLDLIANQLEEKAKTSIHQIHVQPARDYWTSYLLDLGSILTHNDSFASTNWHEVSDFLGYPPVVCAIAPTLEESNYNKSSQRLKRNSLEIGSRSAILTKIIDDLLARETEKVQQQLAEVFRDELSEGQIRALYSYEEQLSRILRTLGIEVPDPLPASLPDEYRARYEESIETFVVDHPFLDGQASAGPRNVVFSDHLRAIVNSRVTYISGNTHGPLQAESLLAVGPFYAHFMTEFVTKVPITKLMDGPRIPAVFDEDYVSDLVSSWVSGTPSDWTPSFHYIHRENDLPVLDLLMERNLSVVDSSAEGLKSSKSLFFAIENPNGLLQLKSPILNVSIATEHGVYIASSGGSITLGPNTTIVAKSLQTSEIDEIVFRSSSNSTVESKDQATLIASPDLRIPGDYKIHRSGTATHTVFAPFLDQRWKAFRPEIGAIEGLDKTKVAEAVMYVRRILTSFRSTNGSPAIHVDKFNRHVVGRNELLRVVADSMQSAGLIESKNGMFIINQDRLSVLGISYDTYSSPDWVRKFSGALAMCLNNDRRLVAALTSTN